MPTPFHEFITDHARGALDDEMSLTLAELVQRVAETGRKGKVVLELNVARAGGSGRKVSVSGKVKTSLPDSDPEMGVFYADDTGGLHKDDPYQQRLDLAPHYPAAPDIARVDPETGEITSQEG